MSIGWQLRGETLDGQAEQALDLGRDRSRGQAGNQAAFPAADLGLGAGPDPDQQPTVSSSRR